MKPIQLTDRDLTSIRLKGVTYIPKVGNLGLTIEAKGINKGLAKIVFMKKVLGGVVIQAVANVGEFKGKTVEIFLSDSEYAIAEFKDITKVDEENSQAQAGNAKD